MTVHKLKYLDESMAREGVRVRWDTTKYRKECFIGLPSLILLPYSRRTLQTTIIQGSGTLLVDQDFIFHVRIS